MKITERNDCRLRLEKVVKTVGEEILSYQGTVRDFGDEKEHGHLDSTIDAFARKTMVSALEEQFSDRQLTLQFELNPYEKIVKGQQSKPKLNLIIDEIDGTTNAKRWAVSSRTYRPHSAICIAVCTHHSLESLEVGTVFTLDQKETYSGLGVSRIFGKFDAYRNGELLATHPIKQGDTKNRLLVIGYTSKVRMKKATIEKAFCELKNCCVYDGCRSSTMDIVNIIRNQYDAYIDPRAVFGDESETRLETYDVAAILPSAYACNLEISDIYGQPLTSYNWEDPLPLLVARPEVYEDVLEVLQDLVKQGGVIPSLEKWQSMLETERRKRGKNQLGIPIISKEEHGGKKQGQSADVIKKDHV